MAGVATLIVALVITPAGTAAGAVLKPGDILVATFDDNAGDARQGVVKVDPVTGKMSLISSNEQAINASSMLFDGPWDLTLMPNGELMVTNQNNGVVAVDPATGKQRLVSNNSQPVNASSMHFSFPTGIVRLPDGDLAVSNNGPPSGILRVDPGTGRQSILSSNAQPVNVGTAYYSDPYDVAPGPGRSLVVSDHGAFGDGGLISVDPSTGKQTKLSSNDQPVNASSQLFDGGVSSAQLYRGTIYVTDSGLLGVIGVDPATGKQRLVSSNDQPINSGSMHFFSPYGLAIEPAGGRILVTDELGLGGDGGLLSVSPTTGKQSIFARNLDPPNAGSSELITYPDGIMVVPPKCGGLYPTIVGTSRRDKIKGTPFPDIIAGLGGRDTIRGLGGADRLCGGPGPDLLIGGKGKDRLLGGPRRDRLRGGPGRDILRGGSGRDILRGGPGRDILRGGPGRDRQKQ